MLLRQLGVTRRIILLTFAQGDNAERKAVPNTFRVHTIDIDIVCVPVDLVDVFLGLDGVLERVFELALHFFDDGDHFLEDSHRAVLLTLGGEPSPQLLLITSGFSGVVALADDPVRAPVHHSGRFLVLKLVLGGARVLRIVERRSFRVNRRYRPSHISRFCFCHTFYFNQ
jgi:hypothetical protein